MPFQGLRTGLGSAIIVDGIAEPMELTRLPDKKGTLQDYVGRGPDWTATAKRDGASLSSTWSHG